ncbi:MAG: peptide deformylase [Candidatus Woesearchaeota archaeon]
MRLITYPNDFLFKIMKPFDWDRLDPIQISNKMKDIMIKNGGIGISANQVGVNARIFVMKYQKDDSIITCINPELIEESKEKVVRKEGCLSFPNVFQDIERSEIIRVKFLDIFHQSYIMSLSDIDARCFLHELDHLNGKIFLFPN